MPRARSAYWSEFKLAAIDTGLARELLEFEVLEVLTPIEIPVRWKQRRQIRRGGEVVGTVWRDCDGVAQYTPGQVLHKEWRKARPWEVEEWQGLPEDQLRELGVFTQDIAFSIQIVEKIKDLPSAIRQRGRHILSRKIFRQRRRFTLAGHAQILTQYASQLNRLVQNFLQSPRPSIPERQRGAQELNQMYQDFENRKTALVKYAREEIQLALQGEFWQTQAHTAQAVALLLADRVRDYEIAIRTIDLALRWRTLMAEIEGRFRACHSSLGQLGQELQDMRLRGPAVSPIDLLRIAQEAYNIYTHLQEQVPKFNPYYERLQEEEFQRLSRVREHAQAGRDSTVYNFIEGAVAKLEAVAIGEQPTRAELSRERESLF